MGGVTSSPMGKTYLHRGDGGWQSQAVGLEHAHPAGVRGSAQPERGGSAQV